MLLLGCFYEFLGVGRVVVGVVGGVVIFVKIWIEKERRPISALIEVVTDVAWTVKILRYRYELAEITVIVLLQNSQQNRQVYMRKPNNYADGSLHIAQYY